MPEEISSYLSEIQSLYKTEHAREHAYRPALKKLIESLNPDLKALNDPKHSQHGAPDFALLDKNNLPVGYIETKDVGVDLDKVEQSEQMERYYGYNQLILTDYLEFRFYKNGEPYAEPIRIAELSGNQISAKEEAFAGLKNELTDFLSSPPEQIKSGKRLAKVMAGKARRIRDNVNRFLASDSEKNKELERVYEAIKQTLVHDLDAESFADMYAQTLVYGLFVARYNDETPENFSRREARDLVSDSNPFLQHFFDHIVGPDFDERLVHIVEELTEIFSHADVHQIMNEYFKKDDLWGKTHEGPDPVIHFYEDFLKEYDSGLRKQMGAFYTPLSVVRFIVRSIDSLLKSEFGLSGGLADTSKSGDTHKVQILDPAVGTGTFLSEVIHKIYDSFKDSQKGRWPTYVHHDLLPRLHGFELMMAPYTIAHLKLGMILRETGFTIFNKRLGVYLTNSLEPGLTEDGTLFSLGFGKSIADEAKEASVIKNETPIMVVLGNPPYSGVSSNETEHANSLVDAYKIEPGGEQKLQERKHWLNDDYVKFIRLSESLIEKNEEGILGFITNHGYLDNPTFRGMRWHLLRTFDDIYIIDLHGNANKKEKAPGGGKDENVFDIQQGVAIILGVKNKNSDKELANVFRIDLWGKRKEKFAKLDELDLEKLNWEQVNYQEPAYYFAQKDYGQYDEYKEGFQLNELFKENTSGIVTMGDGFAIADSKGNMKARLQELKNNKPSEVALKEEYGLGKNYSKWILSNINEIDIEDNKFIPILYRPFDVKWTYFDNKVVWRWREDVMRHYISGDNMGLLVSKNVRDQNFQHVFICDQLSEAISLSSTTATNAMNLPLYLYSEDNSKTPNLDKEIWKKINEVAGKTEPEDVLDYIYAVLHSPSYREKYQEFLKIDFPRVPYPKDKETFWKLAEKGKELRELHLLKSSKINDFITTYPEEGDNMVEKGYPKYKTGKVYINKDQYFGDVPEVAWEFYIGGYQPVQKWLKDRRGRTLTNEDIEHYQKMIVALAETHRIMGEIDEIKFM